MSPPDSRVANLSRILRRLVLLLHALAAGAWLYFMAGGFPWFHLRTLANRGLPAVVVIVSLIGIYADRTGRKALLQAIVTSMAVAWLSASFTGVVLFPSSCRGILPLSLSGAVVLFVLGLKRADRAPGSRRAIVALAVLGGVIGFLLPLSERAPAPTTRPAQAALPEAPAEVGGVVPNTLNSKLLRVGVNSGTGAVTIAREYTLSIEPLLTFISRSPDRCWILFAGRGLPESPTRTLTSWSRGESVLRLRFDDAASGLKEQHASLVTNDLTLRTGEDGVAELETVSQVARPVYSHLNTYCAVAIYGHGGLSLEFLPCPKIPIEVLPFDYPVGRPSRFAYLDAAGVFHVVEATSGEKGPFRELASGRLDRAQSLEITLLDKGRRIATLALADWAGQLSTELSPTAGWGVPQNAIEFSLSGEHPRSAANLFISLAATSVGRGFDTVGHAPGVYRNRMTVRMASP